MKVGMITLCFGETSFKSPTEYPMPCVVQLLLAILRTNSLLLLKENVGQLRAGACGVAVWG